MPELSSLISQISGPVLTPSDEGFAAEVSGFNLAFTNTPDVVVGVTSAADVAAAVTFARDNEMHVDVLATGHGSHGPITSGMIISTKRMTALSIDREARIATIGAGVRWGAVVAAAAEFGLAPVTGSSSTVGVVGYLLGGGVGPMSRSFGFSSDYVRKYTLVTPAGEIVSADASENTELFWGLRGGKGGFGVVTEVQVELLELSHFYGGALIFAEEHIETVLRGWVDYGDSADQNVTTSVMLMHFPPLEVVPAPFRGKTLLFLRFAFPGDAAEGEALAAPLRGLAPVYIDDLRERPVSEVAQIHNDPVDPGPGWSSGLLLEDIDQDFATAILTHVGPGVQTPIMGVEIRQIGGATHRDVPGGSAVGGRTGDYALLMLGAPNPQLFAEVLPGAAAALRGAIQQWVSPETTINYSDSSDPAQFEKAWPTETADRLADIRAGLDPAGTFAYGPHSAG